MRLFLLRGLTLSSLFLLVSCQVFSPRDPDAAELHLRIGTSQLQSGFYPQALASLLQAESLDPENPMIQNNLGLAYLVREKYSLAETHLRRSLELKPDYSDAKNNLGRLLIEMGQYQTAIQILNEAEADLTYPNPEKPQINLGIAYFSLKQFNTAQKYFQKALTVQRDSCLAQNYFGRTFFEIKNFSLAAENLDRAVGYCKKDQFDEPHYYSGLAYYQMGLVDRATARLEEVVSLYPQGKYKVRAQEALKSIRR